MREVTVDWAPKDNVISYLVEVIAPPPAGPGGGALTVVRRYVERPPVTVPASRGHFERHRQPLQSDRLRHGGRHRAVGRGTERPTEARHWFPGAG
jgi:hypothetical protein